VLPAGGEGVGFSMLAERYGERIRCFTPPIKNAGDAQTGTATKKKVKAKTEGEVNDGDAQTGTAAKKKVKAKAKAETNTEVDTPQVK